MDTYWYQGCDLSIVSGAEGYVDNRYWTYESEYRCHGGSYTSYQPTWTEESLDDRYHEDETEANSMAIDLSFGSSELPHRALMNSKMPPAFDGRMSWFAFKELVFDWEGASSTEIKEEML